MHSHQRGRRVAPLFVVLLSLAMLGIAPIAHKHASASGPRATVATDIGALSDRGSADISVNRNGFYEAPSPWLPAPPGTLIRSEVLPSPAGVRAWRILYHSTARDGADVPVSGTVFAPDQPSPPGDFPLLAMGHNTTGIARGCAPSLAPFDPLPGATEAFYEQQVAGFVAAGFVVVATDYQGLGVVDGVHPFLVGETAAHNVLDAARAARALPDLELAPETVLWGHSQGGHAAAWAGQLAPAYAPDVPLSGVILGAPAAEPGLLLAAAMSGQPAPTPLTGYIVSLIASWNDVYSEVAARPALTPAAQATLDLVHQECIPAIAAAYSDQPLAGYVDAAVLTTAPWSDLLTQNAAGRQPINAPVLVVQGTADPLVPSAASEALVRQMCALGTDVEFLLYPEVGHGAVIAAAMPDMLTWASDRLAGRPATPSCAGPD
jgi:pimeloyl-ACP methyl ester carboxylesterase